MPVGGARPGAGRKKGVPNKITADMHAVIHNAFAKLGGVDYLVQVGREDPRTFCALLAKTVPTQITGTLTVRQAATMSDDELAAIASGSRTAADPAPVDQGKLH